MTRLRSNRWWKYLILAVQKRTPLFSFDAWINANRVLARCLGAQGQRTNTRRMWKKRVTSGSGRLDRKGNLKEQSAVHKRMEEFHRDLGSCFEQLLWLHCLNSGNEKEEERLQVSKRRWSFGEKREEQFLESLCRNKCGLYHSQASVCPAAAGR